MSRARMPVVRSGQTRPVEVPAGEAYAVLDWDPNDTRVQALGRYRPKYGPDRWDAHRQVVCDLVLRTDYYDRLRDRHLAGTLHRFLMWAEDHHFSADPEQLLVGDRIDAFVTQSWSITSSSQHTHRWRLRMVAATIFPPPEETVLSRNPARAPHSDADKQRHLAAAEQIIAGNHSTSTSRQVMHRNVTCVLALTYGAGCEGKTVHQVQEKWLIEHTDGSLWLQRPDRAVPVPIAEPWASMLRAALSGRPEAFVVRPDNTGPRNEQTGKVLFKARPVAPGLKGFDCDRAAKAWLRDMLDRAGFAHIAAMMALRPGSQTLTAISEHLPQPKVGETMAALREWSR